MFNYLTLKQDIAPLIIWKKRIKFYISDTNIIHKNALLRKKFNTKWCVITYLQTPNYNVKMTLMLRPHCLEGL